MKNLKLVFVILFSAILFFACDKKSVSIDLSNKDYIELNPNISWAVVIEPYAAFRSEASWSAPTNDHCRLGDVLMITGNAILDNPIEQNEKEIWYRFDKGWLSEGSVSVYQNKLKAQKAASTLTE